MNISGAVPVQTDAPPSTVIQDRVTATYKQWHLQLSSTEMWIFLVPNSNVVYLIIIVD